MSHSKSSELLALRQTLATLPDAKLVQVVEFLDSLSAREAAEAIMAPLRPRLRGVRVRRRFGLPRLVALPLEPLLVDTRSFRPGGTAIPRSALRPISASIAAALGSQTATLEAVLARLDGTDPGALLAAGCQLWPLAAQALAELRAPPDGVNGLPAAEYDRILRMTGTVLGQASQVETEAMRARLGTPPDHAGLVAVLREAAKSGPDGFAAQLTVLLARLPLAENLLAAADEAGAANPALRGAAHQALGALLDRAATTPPPIDNLARAVLETERTAALLDQIGTQPGRVAAFSAQIVEARQATAKASRAGIDHAARITLPALSERAVREPEIIGALEQSARDLKRLATVSRRLGAQPGAEAALREAADRALEKATALPLADRARLVELLCGAEDALALLDRESRAA